MNSTTRHDDVPSINTDHLLTRRQLAERWATTSGRLANDASAGRGPAYVKLGGSVRYRLTDIVAYEAACRVATIGSVAA